MNKLVSIGCIAIGFALSGCASPPPEVSASVPLLSSDATFDADYLSPQVSSQMDVATPGDVVVRQIGDLTVLSGYQSALGLECKKLLVNAPQFKPYKTAACKNAQGWFLTPSLMPVEATDTQ